MVLLSECDVARFIAGIVLLFSDFWFVFCFTARNIVRKIEGTVTLSCERFHLGLQSFLAAELDWITKYLRSKFACYTFLPYRSDVGSTGEGTIAK